MLTGYTSSVSDGKVKDFPVFALRCARQFGALFEMRDDPIDAPIPEKFEVSDYHVKAAEEAKVRLKEVSAWTNTETLRQAYAARRQRREQIAAWNREKDIVKRRYLDMLGEVIMWVPPSEEHKGLKDSMTEQLTKSIRFDCGHTADDTVRGALSGKAFKVQKMKEADADIRYHLGEHRKEVERVNERNEWVRQLRESLAKPR